MIRDYRFERTSTSRLGLASVLMAQSSAGSGIFGDGSSDEELELENLTSGEVVTKLEEVGVVECDGSRDPTLCLFRHG